jgi:hypothetical protein
MPKDLWQRERDKDHERKALGELAAYGHLVSYDGKIANGPRKKKKKKKKKKQKQLATSRQPTEIGIGSRVNWRRANFYVIAMNDELIGLAKDEEGSVERWVDKSECQLR